MSDSDNTTEIILEPKETTELLDSLVVKENESTEIISEPKELDATNESNEPTETVKNIVDILKNVLENTKDTMNLSKRSGDKELFSGEQSSKENITLNSSEISILISILKLNPTLIVEIQESINKILKDNNINISDVPELLAIVKKILDAINNLKNTNKSDIPQKSSNILKFLIRVLIKENIIVVSNSEEFLTNFDKLVDSITELITFLNSNKNPICNINWCNLFRCSK